MTPTPSEPSSPPSLRGLLTRDHERLERLFVELLDALRADAREDTARLWNRFDTGLCSHMAFEEQQILPAFREADPTEASALLREHEQIRNRLSDLGVGLDLHLTRADVVAEFVRLLRSHAEREDALLYQWAERKLAHLEPGELAHPPAASGKAQVPAPAANPDS